jgi:toxin ParE1/3/4
MPYRVELTDRALRDLEALYLTINANDSQAARDWFGTLERAILSLDENPLRGSVTLENKGLRQILHLSRSYVYRVIYKVDRATQTVTVIHIRHGSRGAFGKR